MSWRKTGEQIATGKHSNVFLAEEATPQCLPPKLIAVKTASLEKSDALKMELGFLDKFRNDPFIVQCFGWDQSLEGGKWRYNLLLEHTPEGNLVDLVKNYHDGVIPREAIVAYYAYMILKGLSSIHSKDIVHCDVKPENILVFKTEEGFPQLKLADFGDARYQRESDREFRGSVRYLSPEGAKDWLKLHEKSGDVWALGCTVLWMMSGGKPLWGDDRISDKEVLRMLESGRSPVIPKSVSNVGRNFLKQCFVARHGERPTVDMLLRHPFIAEGLHKMGFEGKVVNPFGRRMASTGLFLADSQVQVKQEKDKEPAFTYAQFQYTRVKRPKGHSGHCRTISL